MKYIHTLLALSLFTIATYSQTSLFQGYGKNATGGRGGTVYHVTNLNDTGVGSLRDAVSQPNRTIVFDVAGYIDMQTTLYIEQDNTTIAGNTAPGGGIGLRIADNAPNRDTPAIEVRFGIDNLIIRHIRIRHSTSYPGGSGADGIYVESGTNIVIDHNSISQYGDEGIAVAEYETLETSRITLSNNIIGWGFTGSSKGSLATGSIDRVTYFQNYFTHNQIRTPAIASDGSYPNVVSYMEVINNVTLGYKQALLMWNNRGTSYFAVNAIGNLYKTSGNFPTYRAMSLADNFTFLQQYPELTPQETKLYPYDNYDPFRTSPTQRQDEVTQDANGGNNTSDLAEYGDELVATPFPTQMYNDNYPFIDGRYIMDSIAPHVGASLPLRDSHDAIMVDDWYNSTVDKLLGYDVPATITLASGTAATDTDNDGIPDDFETANGWNPNLASNNVIDSDTGLTHLEVFIFQDILDGYIPSTGNTIPVITLIGASTINLNVGDTYTELGATATDAEDGSLTPSIAGSVNTEVAGTYTITYSVTDAASALVQTTRTVIVTASQVTTPILIGKSIKTLLKIN